MTGYEMSFSEAFRNARKLKGPGQIFEWNGKHYTVKDPGTLQNIYTKRQYNGIQFGICINILFDF